MEAEDFVAMTFAVAVLVVVVMTVVIVSATQAVAVYRNIVGRGYIDPVDITADRLIVRVVPCAADPVTGNLVSVTLVRHARLVSARAVASGVGNRRITNIVVGHLDVGSDCGCLAASVEVGYVNPDVVADEFVVHYLRADRVIRKTVAGTADDQNAAAGSEVGTRIGVTGDGVTFDRSFGAETDLDAVLGDEVHGAEAGDGVVRDGNVCAGTVGNNPALLIERYSVVLDLALGRTGAERTVVDRVSVLGAVERHFADLVDPAVFNVDFDVVDVAVDKDAEVVRAVDIGVFDLAHASVVVDTDVASGCVNVAADSTGRVDLRRGHVDTVPEESGWRAGRNRVDRSDARHRQCHEHEQQGDGPQEQLLQVTLSKCGDWA